MRGTAAARAEYASSSSVTERPMAVLELNANTGIGYQYAGYYKTATATFSTSGESVVGAEFTTGVRKVNRPIVDGSAMTNIPVLSYVDEPDAHYEETFSIVNCIKANRPNPGIVRMAGNDVGMMVPSARGRLYPASRDHYFKYWRANNLTNSNPFVYYSRPFLTNKIKISVQNYIGVPRNYRVQVIYGNDATKTWTDVWTQANGAFPVDGIFKIYYYDGAWTTAAKTEKIHNMTNPVITNAVSIIGIRMLVTSMNSFFNGYKAASTTPLVLANTIPIDVWPTVVQNDKVPLELIEISPRLALDVTESVVEFDTESTMSEDDSALPVGSINANDAKVTLENFSGALSFNTPGSALYGWEPKRSALDLYFSTGLDSNTIEVNRTFMGTIVDAPVGSDNKMILTAMDNGSVLQDIEVKNFVTLNKSITSIILLLLDYAGVSGFQAHFTTGVVTAGAALVNTENPMIKYYHANEQTVFEALADLAEAYQFALNFDADNVLHMYSKEYLLDTSGANVATFTYNDSGSTLANIKSIEKNSGKPVNDVTIAYEQQFIAKGVPNSSLGEPPWEATLVDKETVAWTAEEEVLSAAPLVKTLSATEGVATTGVVVLDQEGADALAFSGYLLIDGEVISYIGKKFQLKVGGAYTTKTIKSREEYDYWRDRIDGGSRMFFTGECVIPVNGRAKFESEAATHTVETASEYPYTSTFNSYKWQPLLSGQSKLSKTGEYTWNYSGGSVYNIRGTLANSNMPTRNGAESCIRMTNAPEVEFAKYAPTLINPVGACNTSGHAYLTATPQRADLTRPIPRRVGAGVRILGRVDGKKSISALGTVGCGGVGMYMVWSANKMDGWILEVRPTVEAATLNVTLFQVIDSVWYRRADCTRIVEVWPPNQNTSVDTTDQSWVHLDLAYFPPNNATPGKFVGYFNGSACLSHVPASVGKTSAWYGPVVRGDSYMDVDYLWWTDRSDPNDIDGYGVSNDSEPEEYTLQDAIVGGGAPPMWWEDGAESLFKKGVNHYNTFGLQEFGPLAHAVVVRDAEYEGPLLNPRITAGNQKEFVIPVSDLGPFRGKLVIANARRRAVNIAGEAGALEITGYQIEKASQSYTLQEHIQSGSDNEGLAGSVVEAKVAASKAIHGNSPVEIQTDLIQDRATAKNLLNWIIDHCTIDCDTVSLEVFGNPLVECGDKVSIIYPSLGYTAANKFVVMRVTNGWEQGLTTSLVLRRIV